MSSTTDNTKMYMLKILICIYRPTNKIEMEEEVNSDNEESTKCMLIFYL